MSTIVEDVRVFITQIHVRTAGGRKHITESTAQEKERTVEVSEKHASVRVGAEQVYNLGNFESLRINVTIETPCEPDEIPKVLKELTTKLPGRVQRVRDQFKGSDD